MKPEWKVRHATHESVSEKVVVYAAALITTATAGFFVGSAAGWVAGAGAWAIVLIAWWVFGARSAPVLPRPVPAQFSAAYIEEIIFRLDDIARARNWDIDKRFGIACMVSEYHNMTIDELERRYEENARERPPLTALQQI